MPETDTSEMPFRERALHYMANAVIYGMIRVALALPYERRVAFVGALVERVVGPLTNYRRRALENLALVYPEKSDQERMTIARACLNNAGRLLIENYSSDAFRARMATQVITGEGMDALRAANAEGRPVILVTGHFGNYEATRAALAAQGFNVGGLYRNMANPYFNAHYVKTMEVVGGPLFAKGRRGTAGFVRHLRDGGQLVLLFDQHVFNGAVLDFMGHRARTTLSAGELALRFDALLIPFYGIRGKDGFSFETVLEAPIAHSDPETMTRAMNASLEARIRATPGQWFWVHRRWRAHELED